VRHVAVLHRGRPSERLERRRRRCLERLLFELISRGIEHVVLEARAPSQNKLDRDMLDALRARRVVGAGLRMEHVLGNAEPLLWLPDLVCGAVSAGMRGDGQYMDILGPTVMAVDI